MGTKERRERERVETRERIIDAARELFATRGIEATTMRAIANRIEYTPTAIYHHFRDKEELLLEICHRDFRALAQQFVRIGRIDDPVERLNRICAAYVQFAREFPNQYRMMFMTPIPSHEHEDDIDKGNPEEDAYAFLVDTVGEGIQQGRFREELSDPQQLAQMVWGAVHGVISLQLAKGDDPWIEWRDVWELAGMLDEAVIRGILRG
jgi:AcrR family transcriptional regulator